MATITKSQHRTMQHGAPYGNTTVLPFKLETTAAGVAKNSNSLAAIGDGDKVILGTLPAGLSLVDFTGTVSDAFTAATVGKIGFEYVDGVDDAAVPQDDDYFAAALTLHTLGLYRKTTSTAPKRLPKAAYLTLVSSGAAHASAGVLDIAVIGELTGPN